MVSSKTWSSAVFGLVAVACSAAGNDNKRDYEERQDSNPCSGVICNSPPSNKCEDNKLHVYDANGNCYDGVCSYDSTNVDCPHGCDSGSCTADPCLDVTCNEPPATACIGADLLLVYETPGSCEAGQCSYDSHEESCEFGCKDNACTSDPCTGVTCNSPNADYCVDDNTIRSYEQVGTCEAGACAYASQDAACSFGCNNGVCHECNSNPDCGTGRWCNQVKCEGCDTAEHCGDACTNCSTAGQTCSTTGTCIDCVVDGDCAASGKWCESGTCRSCDTSTHCGDSCTPCSGTTPDCGGAACVCNATSCNTNHHCVAGDCDLCDTDDACGPNCSPCGSLHCLSEGTTTRCVECTSDTNCDTTASEVCHPTQKVCVVDSCIGDLYSSDFEANDGGLVAQGSPWEWGTATSGPGGCDSGTGCWATNLDGDYGSCDEGFLTSPTLDLWQCGGKVVKLTFRTWYEYDLATTLYDGLLLEYYDGSQWIQPTPVGGWDRSSVLLPGCSSDGYLFNKPAFGLPTSGWVTKTFQLLISNGIPTFKFRFVHSSDVGTQYAGAYIDDVKLTVE